MKKHCFIFLTTICFSLLFQACRTPRAVVQVPIETPIESIEIYNRLQENRPVFETMNANRISINLMLADQNINARGFMRIIKDSVIVISAQTFGFEVGRVRITSENIDVLDRINNIHYSASADALSEMLGFNFDFNVIQSILSNQIFIYGTNFEELMENDFFITPLPNGNFELRPRVEQAFNTMFIANAQAQLISTILHQNLSPHSLTIEYRDFSTTNNVTFPQRITITIFDGNTRQRLDFTIGNLSFNTPVDASFSVPARFNRRNFENLNF